MNTPVAMRANPCRISSAAVSFSDRIAAAYRAYDRSGPRSSLEESHVQAKFGKCRIQLLAAIEIEEITHRLERPERKPKGQREMGELL